MSDTTHAPSRLVDELHVSHPSQSTKSSIQSGESSQAEIEFFPLFYPTYGQLVEYHQRKLEQELLVSGGANEKTVKQTLRNHLSALHGWLEDKYQIEIKPRRGVDRKILVGHEFSAEDGHFKQELGSHLEYLKIKRRSQRRSADSGLEQDGAGLKKSTLNTRKSLLVGWQKSWAELVEQARLGVTLSAALQSLLKRYNKKVGEVCRAVNIPRNTFENWYYGHRQPSPALSEKVKDLERYFGLPEGALLSLVKFSQSGKRTRIVQGAGGTAFGRRMQKSIKQAYFINEFPPRLQSEWDELYELKTMDFEPEQEEGLQRNSSWYVNDEDGSCPSAVRTKYILASYFGFLCQPEDASGISGMAGKGMSPEDLTLALFGNVPLVKEYLTFARLRTPNKLFNKNSQAVLAVFKSMMRAKTGFVRQHPEYGARLSPSITPDEWDAWCDHAHQRLLALQKEIKSGGQYGQGRDVEEPIRNILKMQHPMHALFEMADRMEADLPALTSPVVRAIHIRDLVLNKMLTANPLRIGMYSKLRVIFDSQGNFTSDSNLYRTPEGYALRFPKKSFKNRRSLDQDYDVALPASLTPYIELYLYEARPFLVGGACRQCLVGMPCEMGKPCQPSEFFFRLSPIGSRSADPRAKVRQKYLSDIVRSKSREYLSDLCPGFGAHAVRHIIAHDYIKNHLKGYEIVAAILHDKLETVRREYSHVKHADFFGHWVLYHEDVRRMSGVGEQTVDALLDRLQEVVMQLMPLCPPRHIQDIVRNVIVSVQSPAAA